MASFPPSASDLDAQLATITSLVSPYKADEGGAREALVKATRNLLNTVESPSEQIWRTLWAEPTHHTCLRVATELELFGYFAKQSAPVTVTQAADDLKVDPLLLRRTCQHLFAMGTILETAPDTFTNTPMSLLLSKPEYVASVTLIEDWIQPTCIKANEYFKSTNFKCPTDLRDTAMQYAWNCKGQTFFEFAASNGPPPFPQGPPWAALFGQMLVAWSQNRRHWMDDGYYPVREKIIEGADEKGVFIVDVGGSNGHDLLQLKDKFPDLPGRCVLQDLKEVVEGAVKSGQLEKSGIEAEVHDFFTPQPVKGARVYYFHSILHDWSDEESKKILQHLVGVMEKGYSKILLQEMVMPDRDAHWQLTSLDFVLLTHFGTKERTVQEWKTLIDGVEAVEGKGKLKLVNVWKHVGSVDSLMEIELV